MRGYVVLQWGMTCRALYDSYRSSSTMLESLCESKIGLSSAKSKHQEAKQKRND